MDLERSSSDPPGIVQWRDSRGEVWDIGATADALILASRDSQTTIPRNEWDARINYNDAGSRMVFRFDIDDAQVGFLVEADEGTALLDQMDWTNERARQSAERLRALEGSRTPGWPTITPWAIVGLFTAGLALLPFIGFAFLAVTILCITVALRKARLDNRLIHVPALAVTSTVLLVIATSANVLACYALLASSEEPVSPALDSLISTPSKITAVLVVLLSLSVHEAAHAVTAWWCGDSGPHERGRVSLNPMVHIDPIGTILVPAFLAYYGGMIFGWARPVLVSLRGVPNPRRANILISAAGPCSNLLLALLFLALYMILGCAIRLFLPQAVVANFTGLLDVHMEGFSGASYLAMATMFVRWGFFVNVLLFFFNLIPLPPLDGGHVLGSLFPGSVGELYRKLGPFTMIIFLALIFTEAIFVLMWPAQIVCSFGFGLVLATSGLG